MPYWEAQTVRVLGLSAGYTDCIIKRATYTGDTICSLELDNEPYRLDVALARLSKQGQ